MTPREKYLLACFMPVLLFFAFFHVSCHGGGDDDQTAPLSIARDLFRSSSGQTGSPGGPSADMDLYYSDEEGRPAFCLNPGDIRRFRNIDIPMSARFSAYVLVEFPDKDTEGRAAPRILFQEEGEEPVTILVSPSPEGKISRTWQEVDLDLDYLGGRAGDFIFEHPGSRGRCYVSSPRLYTAPPVEMKKKPTLILLITIDTLRADRLGCYGNTKVKTPNIDRIGREGFIFTNAISQSNLTNPSHVSLMTSTYGITHGVFNLWTPLPQEIITLQEILGSAGYTTAAVISVIHLNPETSGLGKGFDAYYRVKDIERRGDMTTALAMDVLEKNPGKYLFLWVHYFDPHDPYSPPPPYDEMYYRGVKDDPANTSIADMPVPRMWSHYIQYLKENITDIEYPRAQYDAEVTYADAQVGALLDRVVDTDTSAEPLIALIGDHGEAMGEYDLYFTHMRGITDEILRVPLIIRLPNREGGKRIPGLVQNTDVMPTILEAVELPLPSDLEGRSLMPLMRGERDAIRDFAFIERGHRRAFALHNGRWKFVFDMKTGTKELFDTAQPEGEARDLSHVEKAAAETMQERLMDLIRGKTEEVLQEVPEDPELERKLRELGYLN